MSTVPVIQTSNTQHYLVVYIYVIHLALQSMTHNSIINFHMENISQVFIYLFMIFQTNRVITMSYIHKPHNPPPGVQVTLPASARAYQSPS